MGATPPVLSIPLDLCRAQGGGVLVGCSVGPGLVAALENVAEALHARNPKANTDQILDLIFLRGIVAYTDDLNLPRVHSNPDEDA